LNPCSNNGSCLNVASNGLAYKCNCSENFFGLNCEFERIIGSERRGVTNSECINAGYKKFNSKCYKIYRIRVYEYAWLMNKCFDDNAELISNLNESEPLKDILSFYNLIKSFQISINQQTECIFTGIKYNVIQ
jgi:hypothetical protein